MSSRPSPRLSCKCTTALRCSISRTRPVGTASLYKAPMWATSPSSCITSPVGCLAHSLEGRRKPVSSRQRATRSNWRAQTGRHVVIRALSPALRAPMLTTTPLPWSQALQINERIETYTHLSATITTRARQNSSKLSGALVSTVPQMPQLSIRAWLH